MLLGQLQKDLSKSGITTLHLEVRESNLPAIALYEKLGFVRDGLRPRYYENPTEDDSHVLHLLIPAVSTGKSLLNPVH